MRALGDNADDGGLVDAPDDDDSHLILFHQ